ncbi:MAG: ribokinase [Gemmataceae bacterium]
MSHVVVVGSTNIDLTFRVARLPRTGETLPGTDCFSGFGGKGANQAVMAARLGARVTMVSAVGTDAFAAQAVDNYRGHGVSTEYVLTRDGPTGTACILLDEAANNCIVVVPGANATVSAADVRAAAAAIRAADAVVAQLETPPAATRAAFELARAAGVRTILNPAPALPIDDLLPLTDLLVPNETELQTLTGAVTGTLPEVKQAARSLCRRGPKGVLVTLGAQGALLVEGERAEHVSAPGGEGDRPDGGRRCVHRCGWRCTWPTAAV